MTLSQYKRNVDLKLRDLTPTKRERVVRGITILAAQGRMAETRMRLARRVGPAPTFPGIRD
jgi:hypothetical protein